MKSECFITIKNGKIYKMTDCSNEVELQKDQVPVTSNELAILLVCHGDLNYARNIIRDIEERIASAVIENGL